MANKKKKLIKLNLGAGVAARAGWINVDKFIDPVELKHKIETKDPSIGNGAWEKGAVYIQADIEKLPFSDNYADIVEMHQVLEHIGFRHVVAVLQEVYRVMKPGATLYLDVPGMNGLALDWLEMSIHNSTVETFDFQQYLLIMETIFGNQTNEGEVHRTAFTQPFLNSCLVTAGFTEGEFVLYSKGSPTPKIGELGIGRANSRLRHETLVAIMKK